MTSDRSGICDSPAAAPTRRSCSGAIRSSAARTAYAGIFWKRAHARLLLAACGVAVALARRRWIALLVALPYLKGLRGRARERDASAALLAPYLVLYDVVDLTTAARGSVRHRVPML